jgi:hypothetical protein
MVRKSQDKQRNRQKSMLFHETIPLNCRFMYTILNSLNLKFCGQMIYHHDKN